MTKNQVKIISYISTVTGVIGIVFLYLASYLPILDSPIFGILLFLSVPVVIILFIISAILTIYTGYKEKKFRGEDLQKLADKTGWKYYPVARNLNFLTHIANKLNVSLLGNHPLFGEPSNLLTGRIGDIDVAIFDQTYEIGQREHRRDVVQTFFVLNIRGANFPLFCCEPESFISRMGDVLFQQDIDFPSHPFFSKTYKLYGESQNEDAVRRLFNPAVLNFYEQNISSLTVFGYGSFLLMYEYDYLTPPAEISPQLEILTGLARFFLNTPQRNR